MILQDKVEGNFFTFSNLIRSCYILCHFCNQYEFTSLYLTPTYLFIQSLQLTFNFCVILIVSDQWYEFWVIISKNSDLFFGILTSDLEQNDPYLLIFRGLTTKEILNSTCILYLMSDIFEIWLYTCILFVFHRWIWNIWLDLDLFLFSSWPAEFSLLIYS